MTKNMKEEKAQSLIRISQLMTMDLVMKKKEEKFGSMKKLIFKIKIQKTKE